MAEPSDKLEELSNLKELHDITLIFGDDCHKEEIRSNRFLLCLISTIFQDKMFQNRGDGHIALKKISLVGSDAAPFQKVIQLACCCTPGLTVSGIHELIDLELLANRFQIHAVQSMLETEVLSRLTVANCSIVLMRKLSKITSEHGRRTVWDASLAKAKSDFELFSCSKYFLSVPEAVMAEIVACDELQASCEECIFIAVAKWMRVDQIGTLRGENLLSFIRFPQMRPAFLNAALAHLPTSSKLPVLVAEAFAVQMMGTSNGDQSKMMHLDPRCMMPRKQRNIFHNAVVSSFWLVGMKGGLNYQLNGARGITLAKSGHVLIADTENNRAQIFDEMGVLVKNMDGSGTTVGKFLKPCCLTVDNEDRIVIADTGNHRILAFNQDGSLAYSLGSQGSGTQELSNPTTVLALPGSGILVVDSGNHRVQIYDTQRSLVSTLGGEGSSKGQLLSPRAAAIDLGGNVVVSDWGNHRVQVFRRDGALVRCLGSGLRGSGLGQLAMPYGVAVDSKGNIIVADSGNHRLQVFDHLGQALLCIGSKGCQLGQFNFPCGLGVDRKGRIHVADSSNHRIQVLDLRLDPGGKAGSDSVNVESIPADNPGKDRASCGLSKPDHNGRKRHTRYENPEEKSRESLKMRAVSSKEGLSLCLRQREDTVPNDSVICKDLACLQAYLQQCVKVLVKNAGISHIESVSSGGWGSVFSARVNDKTVALKISAKSEINVMEDHLFREADVYLRAENFSREKNFSKQTVFALQPVTEIFGRTGLGRIHLPCGSIHSVICLPFIEQTACSIVSHLSSSFKGNPTQQDWEDLRSFMRAVVTLIASMHAHGVAHRDLKPSNFLTQSLTDGSNSSRSVCFTFRGTLYGIWICDFGLAQISGNKYCEKGTLQVENTQQYQDMVKPHQSFGKILARKPVPPKASSARAQNIFQSLRSHQNKRPCTKGFAGGVPFQQQSCTVERITAQELHRLYRTFDDGHHEYPKWATPRILPPLVLKSLGSGTPGYRPPKHQPRFVSRFAHSMAADMWAAGIIFLDVLASGRMHVMRRCDARLGRDDKGWELLCHSAVRLDSGRPTPNSLLPLLSRPDEPGKHGTIESIQSITTDSASKLNSFWSEALDLLGGLMCYDSAERFSAEDALHHPFLAETL